MADERATIDLGLLPRAGTAGRAAHVRPSTGRGRWVRWWRRRRLPARRWGQVLLVVVLSLPLAAGGPPSPPRLAALWTDAALSLSGAAQWSVPIPDGRHLYAIARSGTEEMLTAYRVRDGRPAWQARLDLPGEVEALRVIAGVPVVSTDRPHTAAYDPGTGRPVWQRRGAPGREVAGFLLVVEGSPDGGETVTAVDARTGGEVGPVTAELVRAGWRAPDGAMHLVTLDDDGLLTRRPMAADAPAETVGTPHERQEPGAGGNSLSVRDGLVLVTDRAGPEPAVAAYDAATLQHRWTLPDGLGAAPCGPVVCVSLPRAGGPYPSLHGVDPNTGVPVWSASCADAGMSGMPCSLAVHELAGGDRLWLEALAPDRYTGGTVARSWIADAATGERLTDISAWGLRQQVDGVGLLLGRSDRDRAPARPGGPFHLWWARAGPDRSGVEVLGTVDATTCLPHHPYLVCWTDGQGVTVWGIGPDTVSNGR